MPRFFFDTDDGACLVRDQDGLDLPGPEAARTEAVAVLPSLARDVLPDGNHRTFRCTVRDGNGRAVFAAELSFTARWLG